MAIISYGNVTAVQQGNIIAFDNTQRSGFKSHVADHPIMENKLFSAFYTN